MLYRVFIVCISLSLIFVFMSIHIGSAQQFFFSQEFLLQVQGVFITQISLNIQPSCTELKSIIIICFLRKSPIRKINKKNKRLQSVKLLLFVFSFVQLLIRKFISIWMCVNIFAFADSVLLQNSLSFESQSRFAKVSQLVPQLVLFTSF